MAEKFPQPKDTGSRKKTTDSVASGFVGIVNVYQLIPKGGNPVKVADLGIIKPEGVVNYPQPPVKEQRLTKKEERKIREDMAGQVAVTYSMEKDKHDKIFKIRVSGGGQPSSFIDDVGSYDRILQKHPSLIKEYNLSNPDHLKIINKAIHIIKNTRTDKDKAIGRQAMRLGVRVQTMRNWVTSSLERPVLNSPNVFKRIDKAERELLIEKQQEQNLQDEREKDIASKETRMIEVPTPKELPLSLEGRKQITMDEANIIGKYYKLNTVKEIQQADPSKVVYATHKGNIQYFVNIGNTSIERKHKLIKLNMKRPRLIFKIKNRSLKVMKSKIMKENLLRKLQVKIRPKVKSRRRR